MLESEKPWMWGYLHRGAGGRRDENPYLQDEERRQWFRGWDDRDAIEATARVEVSRRRRRSS